MKRLIALTASVLLAAAPLAAQTDHEFVVALFGGGADHLSDLAKAAPVWFMPGYTLGASLGVQLSKRVGLHGDFTYTRNPVQGTGTVAGGDVNRFIYGVHAEYRYPLRQWTPYVFAGLGAVTLDQLGVDSFSPTTRPAVLYGGGLFYAIPATRIELLGEVRGITYNWNMAGFHRNMLDVTYALGLAYRFVM